MDAPSPDEPRPSAESFEAAVLSDVRIGFERTVEQDIGFGIRQQTDIACKALSPSGQRSLHRGAGPRSSLRHLLRPRRPAARHQGSHRPGRQGTCHRPGGTFDDYVRFITAAFGRYGSSDVIVMLALLRLFQSCVECCPPVQTAWPFGSAAAIALADAERSIPRPTDLERIRVSRHVATQHDQLRLATEAHVGYLS